MPQANKTGFIQGHSFAGFLQIGKKCCLKFVLLGQMGQKIKIKNRPKDKYHFLEIKYSKTSLTTTLIWQQLYTPTYNS